MVPEEEIAYEREWNYKEYDMAKTSWSICCDFESGFIGQTVKRWGYISRLNQKKRDSKVTNMPSRVVTSQPIFLRDNFGANYHWAEGE